MGAAALLDPRACLCAMLFGVLVVLLAHRYLLRKRRTYGTTRVFISAIDGRVVAESDALRASANHRAFNLLFPVHTGEIGGLPGRIVVLLAGVWIIGMIVLGVALWSARRSEARS